MFNKVVLTRGRMCNVNNEPKKYNNFIVDVLMVIYDALFDVKCCCHASRTRDVFNNGNRMTKKISKWAWFNFYNNKDHKELFLYENRSKRYRILSLEFIVLRFCLLHDGRANVFYQDVRKILFIDIHIPIRIFQMYVFIDINV